MWYLLCIYFICKGPHTRHHNVYIGRYIIQIDCSTEIQPPSQHFKSQKQSLPSVNLNVYVVRVAVLPIQCKGIVELHMRMSHRVKGRKFLQSLHQLDDGLIILEDN